MNEPVEVGEGRNGIEASIELSRNLGGTLGEVRDWALRYGLETVDVTIRERKRKRTLLVLDTGE